MNYEEKYNEILEWARKNKARLNGVPIEEVFPELAESEDERIRRWLCDYFSSIDKAWIHKDITCIDILRWLEKQKEQKKEKFPPYVTGFKGHPDPAGTSDLEEAAEKYIQGSMCDLDDGPSTGLAKESFIAGAKWQKEQKSVDNPKWNELTWKDIVELEGIINNVHYEFRNGIGQESFGKEVLEKFREYKGDEYLDEIEQKPAEWDKEDKEMFEAVDESLYCYESGKAPEAVAQIEAERCWLSSLPERFNLQPKQEWSEEDEEILKLLILNIGRYMYFGGMSSERILSFLKSLRPQPKAEWSEEDEKMFTDISWAIRYCGYDDKKKKRLNDYLTTLYLHLRPQPHWKPSEEQMEALHRCVDYLEESDNEDAEFMESLLEQLKKLM